VSQRRLELIENGILASGGKPFRGICGVREVADLVGRGHSTIRRWAAENVIPAFKMNGDWAFYGDELQRWLHKQRRRGQ
jgi:excisionase family DNA binding protein